MSAGQNCYQKAKRLADDVRSEHQELYRTLSMFVVSELRTMSGGTEAWKYDIARHTMKKVICLPDKLRLAAVG